MVVEIIDSLMGNGKTTTVLRHIERDYICNKNKWIYVTEYLDELETRTAENADASNIWRFPQCVNGTKLEGLVDLINAGCGLIGMTHNLFKVLAIDSEAVSVLIFRGYSLYFDETIDLIKPYEGVLPGDFLLWKELGFLEIQEENRGRVIAKPVEIYEGLPSTYDKFEKACRAKSIHASVRIGGDKPLIFLTEHIPVDFLDMFDRVLLTTYMFEGSLLHNYFQLYDVGYIKSELVVEERVCKSNLKELLIFDDSYSKKFKKCTLSSSWYKDASKGKYKTELKQLERTIRNVGDKHCRGDKTLLGYTFHSSVLKEGGGKNYINSSHYRARVYLNEDGKKSDVIDRQKSCFISCNARASNNFAHKTVMIHMFNRYPNHAVKCYLQDMGLIVNEDLFALSEMLQWIWRSCIRNGERVVVVVLSARMNRLLKLWIDWDGKKSIAKYFSESGCK